DPYFRIMLLRGMAWAAGESPYRFDPLVLCGARVSEKLAEVTTDTIKEKVDSVPPVAGDPDLLLWLDGSDRQTIDIDAAGNVSQWRSKATGVPLQFMSSPDQQPKYVPGGLGAQPAIEFDG